MSSLTFRDGGSNLQAVGLTVRVKANSSVAHVTWRPELRSRPVAQSDRRGERRPRAARPPFRPAGGGTSGTSGTSGTAGLTGSTSCESRTNPAQTGVLQQETGPFRPVSYLVAGEGFEPPTFRL